MNIEKELELLSRIFSPHYYQVESIKNPQDFKYNIEQILKSITEREAKILKMRVGLEDGNKYTLKEIGQRLKVTGARIGQIESKALRKLKHPSRSNNLRKYVKEIRDTRIFHIGQRPKSAI